jgi:hypothetical protein
MSMHDFNLLPKKNIPKDREEGEYGGERRLAVYHKKGDVVDLQAVGEVANTRPSIVGMRNDYDFVASVDEFLAKRKIPCRYDTARRY